jgi:hypothetical protein
MTKWSLRHAGSAVRCFVVLSAGLTAGCEKIPSPSPSSTEVEPVLVAAAAAPTQLAPTVGTWSKLANPTPTTSGVVQLEVLTNGSVLLGDDNNSWWTLTPDRKGSYQNGTWLQVASSNYIRAYGPSTTLADGRFLMGGGEYTLGTSQSNIDIYDPVKNTWTEGPNDMPGIMGDTASSILPDGTFYVSSVIAPETYFLNPATLTWTQGPTIGTGTSGGEKGWTLLQDGTVLDAFYTGSYFANGVWTATGLLPNVLTVHSEIGPMSLLYSGKVIQFGASDLKDPPVVGNTAIYDPNGHTWAAGPSAPDGLQWADTSAVVMANGHVLTTTSADTDEGGGKIQAIWEYDPTVDATTCAATPSTCFTNVSAGDPNLTKPFFLALPDGEVLVADQTTDQKYLLYKPNGSPALAWRPTLTSLSAPSGGVYTLTGTQLNGLTNGTSFGDDLNSASDYPIVGLKDTLGLGNVYYARSYQFNQMAPLVNTTGSCSFVLPPSIPMGSYVVFVSASGVTSSNSLPLNVQGMHVMSVTGSTSVSPGSTAVMTVTISGFAPNGGTLVTLASDNTGVATVPASVTVPAGNTKVSFLLTSRGYGVAHISASVPNSQFQPASLEFGWNVNSVYANQVDVGVTCYPCSLVRGRNDAKMPTGATSSDAWTVNISNAAPGAGVVVSLQSSDTRLATVPASVTIPSGQKSATFQVSRGSQLFGSTSPVTITATLGPGFSKSNSIVTFDSNTVQKFLAQQSLLLL